MMIWRCRPWFDSEWSGSEQSVQELRRHILKHQIEGENLILHLSKYGV